MGVYQIRSIKSGNLYVGSARNVKLRWAVHRCALKKNKHHCHALQKAWDKYGEDNFLFELLETCQDSELREREQFFIDSLNPAYNSARIVDRPSGINRELARQHILRLNQLPWTEERREMARERGRNRVNAPVTEETRKKMSLAAVARKKREKELGMPGPRTIEKLRRM